MTLTLVLRADAVAEAARLTDVRARIAAPIRRKANGTDATNRRPAPAGAFDGIAVTMIRARAGGAFGHASAIVMTRARILDQPGRLLEELVVPIELKLPLVNPGTTLRAVKALAQRLLDLHQRAVIAVAREQISKRLADISAQYGRGVQRSLRREERLAAILATEAPPLVQAGLFDRRALKARASDRSRDSLAWDESDARRRTLRSAVAGVTAQEPEIVLVLLVSTSA